MEQIINISQIVVAIILVIVVLVQQRGTSLGGAFGGQGDIYASRRGLEKTLYVATIVIGAVFVALAIANILI